MNTWIKSSIQIANSPEYLDNLSEVYPVTLEKKRVLPTGVKQKIKAAYDKQDKLTLVGILLRLEKFPIKDPYVAFLRKRKSFLNQYPKTIERLSKTLLSMKFDELIEGCEEPKEFNRQIGTLFKKWLPKLGYPFLSEQELGKHREIAFLKGTNGDLMKYANKNLGCSLRKGLDFLAKVGNKYVIGEAKFLTDYGGHQIAQFEDALRLIRSKEGKAIRVAVLDGVVWIKSRTKMYRTVCELEGTALSALLLKDFLESFR